MEFCMRGLCLRKSSRAEVTGIASALKGATLRKILFALLIPLSLRAAISSTDPAYTPLWLYQGSWEVSRSPGQKPDRLVNECALVGRYFTCQQAVNGQPGALLVIIPTGQPGRYYTQTIMPEGRATGRDDLEISGERWTYLSRRQEGGKTTRYRTTNTFTGKDRIHFEQAEASGDKDWVVKGSGDERRISTGRGTHTL